MLADKMRDISRTTPRLGIPSAVHARVHKVADTVLQTRVDERLALALLGLGGCFAAEGGLHGEDAPDGGLGDGAGGGEDGGGVVEVAGDELDEGGFAGEELGGGGGGVAGEGEDFEGGV